MNEILLIFFGISCLCGIYLGLTIGDKIKKCFIRLTVKEPDVEYAYKNLNILIEARLKELTISIRNMGKKQFSDEEVTTIANKLTEEIYDSISDNMKEYLYITLTDKEILRYIAFAITNTIMEIMRKL